MPDQAYDLVYQIYEYGPSIGVDWYEDWKLISFLIGGNDLCRFCNDPEGYSADAYVGYIRTALDYLMAEGPPKMLIVLSTIFDITPLPAFSDSFVCEIFQGFVCPCGYNPEYHPEIKTAQRQYHRKLVQLIESGRYDNPNRPDFTVVMEPHFQEAQPPKIPGTDQVDGTFWAVDCFHPGRKAHYAMAISLWNQLFEPEGRKRTALDWSLDGLTCPTEENPFIQTRMNGPPSSRTRAVAAEIHDAPAPLDVEPEGGDRRGAIIGGTVGGFLVICLAVGAVIGVIKYRKRKEDETPLPMSPTA